MILELIPDTVSDLTNEAAPRSDSPEWSGAAGWYGWDPGSLPSFNCELAWEPCQDVSGAFGFGRRRLASAGRVSAWCSREVVTLTRASTDDRRTNLHG